MLLMSITLIAVLDACKPQTSSNTVTSTDTTTLLKDTISDVTARQMVKNFDGRAHHFKKGGIILPDTRCVWFNIDQLRALVNRVDKEKGDGIRFYLAAYDSVKMPALSKVKDIYLNYGTLVMVSTRADSAGRHIDYYKNLLGQKKGVIITAVPENQGELCPPPAHCSATGATLLP